METIIARIEDSGRELQLSHDLTAGEREIIVCGGLLSFLRRHRNKGEQGHQADGVTDAASAGSPEPGGRTASENAGEGIDAAPHEHSGPGVQREAEQGIGAQSE